MAKHPITPPIGHGGALDAAARRTGIAAARWLDLSTGINADAYPLGAVAADAWRRLPDEDAFAGFAAAAAGYYGIPDAGHVVPAPGSQALIQWLPRLVQPMRTVAVLSPTYAEHAAAWGAAGHTVHPLADPPAPGPGIDVIVAVNPNNPDGRRLAPEDLAAAATGRLLIVDEAFADVAPELTMAPYLGRLPGLIILRSFGKFFGLAGLRLGAALAAPPWNQRLAGALGPWCVSGPALEVGSKALKDTAWIADSRRRLAEAAGALDAVLAGAGFVAAGGTALFRLARHAKAPEIAQALEHAAILVRTFADAPGLIRFGVPMAAADQKRLAGALAHIRL